MKEKISDVINDFSSISLGEMDSVTLMNRLDTKYFFDSSLLPGMLRNVENDYRVLEIDNTRVLPYETLYFDTQNMRMYHKHINGKLNRHKVRRRKYVVSGDDFLEIKFKSNKGYTIKNRMPIAGLGGEFGKQEIEFIESETGLQAKELTKAIKTQFYRITLVNKTFKERVTIDIGIKFTRNNKPFSLPYLGIVELKQEYFTGISSFARQLKNQQIRPNGISKYCLGTALLYPKVKSNSLKPKLLKINKLESI